MDIIGFFGRLIGQGKLNIQSTLQQLVNDAQNMVGNPGQPQFQNAYAARLKELKKSWASLTANFEPREAELVTEIGGEEFFLADLPKQIEVVAHSNPHTPSVTQQFIAEFMGRRNNYLSNLHRRWSRSVVLRSIVGAHGIAIGSVADRCLLFGGKTDIPFQGRQDRF